MVSPKERAAPANKAARPIWSPKGPITALRRRNRGRSNSLGPQVDLIRLNAGYVIRHRECRTFRMTSGANSKFVTRLMAVVFVGLAFAGCAMMFVQSEKSLFAETSSTSIAAQ